MEQNEMTLNEYQRKAMSTRMKTCDDVYMLLNLAGEVGELASKVAKQIRKGNTKINENGLIQYDLEEDYESFDFELISKVLKDFMEGMEKAGYIARQDDSN